MATASYRKINFTDSAGKVLVSHTVETVEHTFISPALTGDLAITSLFLFQDLLWIRCGVYVNKLIMKIEFKWET